VTLPGPAFGPWAVDLIGWAIAIALSGEFLRWLLGQLTPIVRALRPIERGIIDLYLGGGLLFGLAALPVPIFTSATPIVAVALALVGLVVVAAARGFRSTATLLTHELAPLARPPALIAIGSAALLFLVELATALAAPTGNTFDSSVLAFFVARLGVAHTIPLSYLPSVAIGNPYPQGTTVWLFSAQSLFGLPPARTSLYVTPLFLGLAPLAAFTVGDRLLGGPRAGAVLAVSFAFVSSWTRLLVAGSNDFVLAFPLVLWLFARTGAWAGPRVPGWRAALGFGAIAGVAASLNPAGPFWLFATLLVLGALARPAFGGRSVAWFGRWVVAAAAGALAALPSLYEEIAGGHGLFASGGPAGLVAPPAGPVGLSLGQFVGLVDPFLFRANDVWLSPFPIVRGELALLLVAGAALLLVPVMAGRLRPTLQGFRPFALAGVVGAIALLGLGLLASVLPALARPLELTSFAETSILLFALYGAIAALPLIVLVDRTGLDGMEGGADPPDRTGGKPLARPPTLRRRWAQASLALGVAFLLLVPGVVLTGTSLPGYELGLYRSFGNVSTGDFDLLVWGGSHLPAGARVLVAPGSAAEFLLGYAPDIVLLYPMVDGVYVNASYRTVIDELTNGTLAPAGLAALAELDVGYIAVTERNSALDPPLLPQPLLADPDYGTAFHEADAYLFERVGASV
jgi:hypothetical protein